MAHERDNARAERDALRELVSSLRETLSQQRMTAYRLTSRALPPEAESDAHSLQCGLDNVIADLEALEGEA